MYLSITNNNKVKEKKNDLYMRNILNIDFFLIMRNKLGGLWGSC